MNPGSNFSHCPPPSLSRPITEMLGLPSLGVIAGAFHPALQLGDSKTPWRVPLPPLLFPCPSWLREHKVTLLHQSSKGGAEVLNRGGDPRRPLGAQRRLEPKSTRWHQQNSGHDSPVRQRGFTRRPWNRTRVGIGRKRNTYRRKE